MPYFRCMMQGVDAMTRVLERLGVPYFIAGSAASSLYGIPRATQDFDFVVALRPDQAEPLVAELEKDFYLDMEAVREAVLTEGSFNLIRWETMDKVDVFVKELTGWAQAEFERRRAVPIPIGDETVTLYFASPEDTLLHKLLWFQTGGDVSQQRWNDILGILKVQGLALDRNYLERVATEAGLIKSLREAMAQAG